MEQKNLKWKEIYERNNNRRFCEIIGIKKENVEVESNSFKALKEKKNIAIISILIFIVLLVWTFRNDIKILFIVLGFFLVAGIIFFAFTYYRFKCLKDGLYIRFGIQEGTIPYDKVKCVYLSKYNDYSFLIPTKRLYSIVIRYEDGYKRIKELSFPNYFLSKENTVEFLDNFNIKETQEEKYVQYERFKMLKRIGRIILLVLFVMFVIGIFMTNAQ